MEQQSVAQPQNTSADGLAFGLVVAILGPFGLAFVYSRRPPSSAGDVLEMLMKGRENFLNHGPYEMLLIVAVGIIFGGFYLAYRAVTQKAAQAKRR